MGGIPVAEVARIPVSPELWRVRLRPVSPVHFERTKVMAYTSIGILFGATRVGRRRRDLSLAAVPCGAFGRGAPFARSIRERLGQPDYR